MNPAAKLFDIVMGVDIHLVQPPGPVPPLPIPHPFVGLVFDPMEFVPILGATVIVNGVPRAQAGTGAKDVPVHIPLGGTFIKPPGNEGEMFMGSATVLAEGEPFSYMALPTLSCHDIGMIAPPRMKKKGGGKSMMLPTSVVLPIPMGKPVLVGGPPTISLTGMAMKIGMAALGKAVKKFKSFKKAKNADPPSRVKANQCTSTGHPVNVADGNVFTSVVDFELPGPIPFKWERYWFSNNIYNGPLGQGWFQNYDLALEVKSIDEEVVAHLAEGRLITFALPKANGQTFNRQEKLTLIHDGASLFLRDHNLLTYRFQPEGAGDEASRVHYLTSIEDPNGFSIRFEYAQANTLSRITDSAGREMLFSADENGRIIQIEAPHPEQEGEWVVLQSYEYDELGNMIVSRDALHQEMRYEYQRHLLTRETNRNGLSFYFAYDGTDKSAKCSRTWGDGGIYDHKLTYLEGQTVVENSLGHQTVYFHEGGLVRKTIDPNGGVTVSTYNEHNELIAEKDPLGLGPSYVYDDRGNQILAVAPDGAATQIEYNPLHLPVKAIDPVGGVWQWQYDEKGNLTQRTDPLGHATRYTHHGGHLTEILNPLGGKTILGYDPHLNLKMLVTPDGYPSWWTYDFLGRCTEATDPKGNSQFRKYDLLGRVGEVREPDGNVRRLRYDGEGNVIRAHDQHHDVRFTYAGMNRMTSRTEAGTRVEFQYDLEEQLTGIVNEHGFAYRFAFDANGEVVEEQGFDGLRRVYVRDAAGKVAEVQRPGGLRTQYAYDAAGRITKVSHSDGTRETFAYREDGELVEATNQHAGVQLKRDLLGQIVQERQGEVTIASTYDALGNRLSVRSSLGAAFAFARNEMGDVQEVQAGDFKVNFQRDSLGLELEREFSGGLRSRWSRDRLGRPVKQETFTGGGFMQRTRTYTWAVNDRLRQIMDSQRGLTRFGHDAFGNLAWSENPDGSVLYRMPDAVGNLFRTKERKDRRYGPGGQLLQSGSTRYAYDEEGNLIRKVEAEGREWQYFWEASGQLSRVVRPDGEEVTFTYDALGRRLSKTFRGRTTRWVWDGNTPLHEWVEEGEALDVKGLSLKAAAAGGSQLSNAVVTWLFEPESFSPLAKLKEHQTFGIVTDHLGTPMSMHGGGGEAVWSAEMDIYGEVRKIGVKKEECPFRFPGQYADEETGLYYNRFRYYDPKEGVYVSQDPIGLVGGDKLYSYVNDPNTWIDEYALSCKKAVEKLPQLKGKSIPKLKKILKKKGFVRKNPNNPKNERWVHPDGSEVQIHKYGNANTSPYKSGNNAHAHKSIGKHGEPNSIELNDKGFPSTNAAEMHIGIRNPKDYPVVSGRNHGT